MYLISSLIFGQCVLYARRWFQVIICINRPKEGFTAPIILYLLLLIYIKHLNMVKYIHFLIPCLALLYLTQQVHAQSEVEGELTYTNILQMQTI